MSAPGFLAGEEKAKYEAMDPDRKEGNENSLIGEAEMMAGYYVQFPVGLLRSPLSNEAKLLWCHLASYLSAGNTVFPGRDTLMAALRCSDRAYAKAKEDLETHGLLEVTRRGQGRTNLYKVCRWNQKLLGDNNKNLLGNSDKNLLGDNTKKIKREEDPVEADPDPSLVPAPSQNGASVPVGTQMAMDIEEGYLYSNTPLLATPPAVEPTRSGSARDADPAPRTSAAREKPHNLEDRKREIAAGIRRGRGMKPEIANVVPTSYLRSYREHLSAMAKDGFTGGEAEAVAMRLSKEWRTRPNYDPDWVNPRSVAKRIESAREQSVVKTKLDLGTQRTPTKDWRESFSPEEE